MSNRDEQSELFAQLGALRARLAEIEQRIEAGGAPERELPEAAFHVLVARVGGERVALWLAEVREVVPVAAMLGLPEAPPWIPGLLEIRGAAIPVIDVAARMQRSSRRLELSDLVVVCRAEPRDVGLVVQEVFDVRLVERSDVIPPLRDVPHGPYLRGALRDGDGLLLLLSLRRMIDTSDVPEIATEDET